MVSERLPWSEAAAAWLRDAVALGLPILGVCYGHQLLAHALGGRVDYHASGREIGTVAIERLPAAADDALLAAAPARFVAHASHQQSVLELPAGAVVLARSAHDPHHAVRYAPRAWGLQFHPEFSVESCAATCNGALAPPMAIARRPVARRAHTRPRRRPPAAASLPLDRAGARLSALRRHPRTTCGRGPRGGSRRAGRRA